MFSKKNVVTECNWNLIYFHGQWTRNANLLIFRAFCGLRLSENEMRNSMLLEVCAISEKFTQRKSVKLNYFPFCSLLSNLWWMSNSTSKDFEPVMRTGSSRQLQRNITAYGWVSNPVSLAAVALSWRYRRILYHRGVECKMQSWNLMIMYCMRSKRRHDKVYSIKEEERDIHFVPWQLRE